LSGNPTPENSLRDPYIDLQQTNLPVASLLEAARKVSFRGSIWFASSVAVYGRNPANPLSEDDACLPLSLYGISKLFAEQQIQNHAAQFGLRCGIYRLFSTYGPGLKRQLVFDTIAKLKENPAEISLYGSGSEGRDLSYVDDQARAIASLSEKVSPAGDIFN